MIGCSEFFARRVPNYSLSRKQAVYDILHKNLLVAGDDIETDLGLGDPKGKTNTHAVNYVYFRRGVTHGEMTRGDRDRYERTLKDSPFVKPCYIEELDATSDYLYYWENPGHLSEVSFVGVHYWDVVDTMNGRQVFHTNFQVKMLRTGGSKKAIYQSEDWTCGPFLIVTFMQTLLRLYVEKNIDFEWPRWRQRLFDEKWAVLGDCLAHGVHNRDVAVKRRRDVWAEFDQKKKVAGKSGPPCDDAALDYCLVTLLRSCLDGAAAREFNKTEPPSREPLKCERNGFVWNQDDPRIVAMIREKERFAGELKDKERRDRGKFRPVKRK